jgi:hypothetical protein
VVDNQAEEAVEEREVHLLVHLLELRLDHHVRLACVAREVSQRVATRRGWEIDVFF